MWGSARPRCWMWCCSVFTGPGVGKQFGVVCAFQLPARQVKNVSTFRSPWWSSMLSVWLVRFGLANSRLESRSASVWLWLCTSKHKTKIVGQAARELV